jgi:hypothetical protein
MAACCQGNHINLPISIPAAAAFAGHTSRITRHLSTTCYACSEDLPLDVWNRAEHYVKDYNGL